MTYDPTGVYFISPDGLGTKQVVSTSALDIVSVSINYDDDTICMTNYGK